MKHWYLHEAVALCVKVEEIARKHGYHVALTGGVLYKQTPRKDCDLVFYQVRQKYPDKYDLLEALNTIGLIWKADHGFVVKATYTPPLLGPDYEQSVDLMFPDEPKDTYSTYA